MQAKIGNGISTGFRALPVKHLLLSRDGAAPFAGGFGLKMAIGH
jgi:hypothetical protein